MSLRYNSAVAIGPGQQNDLSTISSGVSTRAAIKMLQKNKRKLESGYTSDSSVISAITEYSYSGRDHRLRPRVVRDDSDLPTDPPRGASPHAERDADDRPPVRGEDAFASDADDERGDEPDADGFVAPRPRAAAPRPRPAAAAAKTPAKKKTPAADDGPAPKSSQYFGVHALPNGKFKAALKAKSQIGMDRVDAHGLIYLGTFDDEVDAARAYDARARFLGELAKCNFVDDDGSAPMRNERARSSQYRGVHASPSGKFIASLSCKSQMGMDGVDAHNVNHLGSFDDEVDAARAYDARARFLGLDARCNFPDDDGPAPKRRNRRNRRS